MTRPAHALGARLRGAVGRRSALFGQAGVIAGLYGVQQIIRLGTNLALAWLLAPELLGTMLIINTLRTGGELLSDVGIGQSVVNNARGEEPRFVNTAWTLQIIRGLLLFAAALALTGPIAAVYDDAGLRTLLPVAALIFVISGFASPTRFLLQRRLQVEKLALFETGATIASGVIHIALAMVMPTIWALIYGLLLGALLPVIVSFFLLDWRHRLVFDREAAGAILRFGKWVFAATLIYFLATNIDRLYLGDALSIALLGIYGIARTYAETGILLIQRLANLIIFPKISASLNRGEALRGSIATTRAMALAGLAVALALAVTFADQAIYLLYDDRYRLAAIILPALLAGVWFSMLAALGDGVMLGVGRPVGIAIGNGVKLVAIVAMLPLALSQYGLVGAIAALLLGDLLRYLALAFLQKREGLGFLRQDFAFTLLFILLVLSFRVLSGAVGLSGGVEAWRIAGAALAHG